MSIYKRNSGRWAVLIDLDRGANEKRARRALGTFATKKEAETAERQALETRDRGIDLSPKTTTMAEVVARFLRESESRLSPTTFQRYEELWRLYAAPTIGAVPIGRLKPAHIAEVYTVLAKRPAQRGGVLSARTVHHVHRFLHRVLGWAEKLNLVERNVSRAVDPPRPAPSPARALTPDEAAALLAAAEGSRFRPFLLLALTTGARRGELCALTWDAVDFERATVTIRQALGINRRTRAYFVKTTKTGRERVVSLSTVALDALRRLRAAQAAEKLAAGTSYADGRLVFSNPLGEPVGPDSMTKAFARFADKAGLSSGRLHDLRHSAATWALANGTDVRTVATMLGHSAPSTTLNIYGHVVAGLQERAAEGLAETLLRAQARRASAEK